jgi:glutamate racemase
MSRESPILVLDSGLGGLTVARALHAALPHERVLYFGDTARLPYGSKSPATVTHFVRQIIRFALPLLPKHVVIACNTASALALPSLRGQFPGLPVSGVVDPGARAAVHAAGSKEFPLIGIIATEATIRSRAYELAIGKRRQQARLIQRATPLLVPIIEEGRDDADPLVSLALRQYLDPIVQRGADVLVLGCTHYPLLRPAIERAVGPKVAVIDSAQRCAEDVARRLASAQQLAPAQGTRDGEKWIRCFVTDDAARFQRLAERFLGEPIDPPTLVPPDDLYATDALAIVAGG